MIKELLYDFIYEVVFSALIITGILLCTYLNNEIVWENQYQNWEYNLDFKIPSGFEDAIIKTEKKE